MNTHRNEEPACRVVATGYTRARRAFTLTELLVVTALTALLSAILCPAVQRAGWHARAVACQSRLRQWGLGFSMFLEELDQPVIDTSTEVWDLFWRCYCDRRKGLFLCPMASRYEVNTNDPLWMDRAAIDCGLGSKFTAWKLVSRTPTTLEPGPLFGSYGYNGSGPTFLDKRIRGGRRYTSSNVPVFLDSVDVYVQANARDDPPAYDGQVTCPGDMKRVCIDRHEGTINSLFLDWSVREVGLKELWTLDWSPFFDRQNRWTRAGGVQPTDWPQWMRGFRDY